MLRWAVYEQEGPVAIRYPRGGDRAYQESAWDPFSVLENNGALCCHRKGDDVTIVTYGTALQNAMEAADILAGQGISATVLRLQTLSPLPVDLVMQHLSAKRHVVVVEEVCAGSGIRQDLAWAISHRDSNAKVDGIDLGHRFVPHGAVDTLYRHCGLDGESIAKFVQEVRENES